KLRKNPTARRFGFLVLSKIGKHGRNCAIVVSGFDVLHCAILAPDHVFFACHSILHPLRALLLNRIPTPSHSPTNRILLPDPLADALTRPTLRADDLVLGAACQLLA